MRILVTGGAGYIGSAAARLFHERGHDVWAFDNLGAGHARAAPPGRLIVGDLADQGRIEAALKRHGIEAVVHFAVARAVRAIGMAAPSLSNNDCGLSSDGASAGVGAVDMAGSGARGGLIL